MLTQMNSHNHYSFSGGSESEGGGGSNVSLLSVEPGQKLELDQLLETARSTLQKLEDTFSQNVDIAPIIIHCYREILRINRNCRDLNKMLDAAYFDDPKLMAIIGTIRKELKREQASSMARQVAQLFETNCRISSEESKAPADSAAAAPAGAAAAAGSTAAAPAQTEASGEKTTGSKAKVSSIK